MIPTVIEREVLIEAPVDVVWKVVTEPEQITRWFTDSAQIDVRPGGEGTLFWDKRASNVPTTAHILVETVDPPHTFSFRWGHPEGAEAKSGNSMLVEFTLRAEGENTRLRVVESGVAELDWPEEQKATYVEDHNGGWKIHLTSLDRKSVV